jgi:hypothetical protein
MRPVDPNADTTTVPEYRIVSTASGDRVNPDNTTTPIMSITFRSVAYDVTATFNVTQATFVADGAPPLVQLRVSQVNQIAGHPHVIGVHGEEDIGNDGNLYNYLVVTVGDADGGRETDVRIRMDQIGQPSAFAAIDRAWALLENLGPS